MNYIGIFFKRVCYKIILIGFHIEFLEAIVCQHHLELTLPSVRAGVELKISMALCPK